MASLRAKQADASAVAEVAILGAGTAGTTLGCALAAANWPLGAVACRTVAQAEARVAEIGAGRPVCLDDGWLADQDEPVIALICVPDDRIREVARVLTHSEWPDPSNVFHISGATRVNVLADLRSQGVSVGSMHPLTSFTSPREDAADLAGTTFALAGDDEALAIGNALVTALGGRALLVPDDARAAWHAGAAHASNHLVALVDQSLDMLTEAGLDRDEGRTALVPLLRSVLAHLEDHTTDACLTGPVARGDVDVVAQHLETIAGLPADATSAYRALAARAVDIAERSTRIPATVAQQLRDTLRSKDH